MRKRKLLNIIIAIFINDKFFHNNILNEYGIEGE